MYVSFIYTHTQSLFTHMHTLKPSAVLIDSYSLS